MSQIIEISFNTKCYLCDALFLQSQEPFEMYKCFYCQNDTPYCYSCDKKLQKLFGRGNLFKCDNCNKLTNAKDKIEIDPSSKQEMNNNNIAPISKNSYDTSVFKTPTKPNGEERKDNNNNNMNMMMSNILPHRNMLSNFINDFNSMGLGKTDISDDNDQVNNNNNSNNINTNNNNNSMISNSIFNNSNLSDLYAKMLQAQANEFSSNSNNSNSNSNNMIFFKDGKLVFCKNSSFTGTNNSKNNNNQRSDFSLLKTRKRIENNKNPFSNDYMHLRLKDQFRGYNKSKSNEKSKERVPSTSPVNNYNFVGSTKPKKISTRSYNFCSMFNNTMISNNNNNDGGLDKNAQQTLLFLNNNDSQKDGTATPHRIYSLQEDEFF